MNEIIAINAKMHWAWLCVPLWFDVLNKLKKTANLGMQDLSIPNQPHPAGAAAYGYAKILPSAHKINIYSNDVKAGYCSMFLESLGRGEIKSHAQNCVFGFSIPF